MSGAQDAPFLPYGRHHVEEDDVAAVVEVLRGDWLTTGPTVRAFEEAFAEATGSRYAVVASSGTAALHLAALAAGLGEGTTAIVPSLTFLATANCVRHAGGEVIFADCDPDTGLMRPCDLADALDRTGEARAALPVHLNGQCADLAGLRDLAERRRLVLIEDACHALGATWTASTGETHRVGSCRFSDLAVFSLHPVKVVAMGEGGVVATNDAHLYGRLLRLRNHGMVANSTEFQNRGLAFDAGGTPNPWYYEMAEPGYNYRASDLHCALGLSQLRKLDRFVARRRELVARYARTLAPLAPVVRPIARVPACTPAWHLCAVRVDFAAAGVDRATVMRRLRAEGIGTQVHFVPVHLQPYYARRYDTPVLPGALAYYERTLSLPLFVGMTDGDVERVVAALARILGLS